MRSLEEIKADNKKADKLPSYQELTLDRGVKIIVKNDLGTIEIHDTQGNVAWITQTTLETIAQAETKLSSEYAITKFNLNDKLLHWLRRYL